MPMGDQRGAQEARLGARRHHLQVQLGDDQREGWVVPVLTEVASEVGWTVSEDAGAGGRPDAVAVVVSIGVPLGAIDEPAFFVSVEAGTPRSPTVLESATHLPARFELTVGAFKARRNQQVTRDAVERFLVRVEQTQPATDAALDPALADGDLDELDPSEAVARAEADGVVAENLALLERLDAWLARSTLTPAAAQAVQADRTILEAALTAPVLDLVIIGRVAARLAAATST